MSDDVYTAQQVAAMARHVAARHVIDYVLLEPHTDDGRSTGERIAVARRT